ncbi:MAG TPA: EAL domain-containing protein [Dongiaceae bacterium]|nr:EAL domain-containing protein [Dongiaceae bacterium]
MNATSFAGSQAKSGWVRGLSGLIRLLVLAMLLAQGSIVSAASSSFVLADSQPRILLSSRIAGDLDISNYLEVLSTNDEPQDLQALLAAAPAFQPVDNSGIATSPRHSQYWVRGSFSRSLAEPNTVGSWLLILENTRIRQAHLYVRQSSGSAMGETAASYEAVEPVLGERYPQFALTLAPDSTLDFYILLQTDGLFSIPVKVWSRDAYLINKRSQRPVWGLLFGALSALMLYNLFVYLSLRERAYLQLSLFLLSSLLLTLAREGFVFSSFSPFPWIADRFEAVAEFVTLALAILFTRSYLNTKRYYPVIDAVLRANRWLCLGLAFTTLLGLLSATWVLVGLVLSGTLFLLPAVLASMHAADRATRYYIAGWSVFFVGYLIYQFSQLGLLPVNDFTQRGRDLALCFLGLSLSLGMAEQIRRERFEKQRALQRQQDTMLELKYSEEQMQKKVLRDTLQEFPSLPKLQERLADVVAQSARASESLILVMMDLHNVNRVEEQLGHAARNELLTRATKRLSVILRSVSGVLPLNDSTDDYVPMAVLEDGRYGFILRGMSDITINHAIEQVEQAMSRPFFYQGLELQPGISFGLARLGEHGEEAPALLTHAERSLVVDRRKNLDKECELQGVDHYNERNIALINELRSAIHEDQITLYFQPVYDLRRDLVCGVEVFSRWESLSGARISPGEIFHLAEIGGFVSELTLRVIEKALRHFVVAVNVQQSTLKLSINLSPRCLREEHFLEEVGLLLTRYGLPPQRLSLEIKEAAIIEDPSITRDVLNRIRNLGIGLTIDELGAAYSNPSYLSSLPVTEVKLDQRFVAQLDNADCRVMVQMLIALCREQHIKLVVHGVEEESTLHQLELMGCSFAQGHYLAAPVQAREFKLPRHRSAPLRFQQV